MAEGRVDKEERDKRGFGGERQKKKTRRKKRSRLQLASKNIPEDSGCIAVTSGHIARKCQCQHTSLYVKQTAKISNGLRKREGEKRGESEEVPPFHWRQKKKKNHFFYGLNLCFV